MVGRLLVGLGIGVSAVVVPAYLGEVAPANLRGRIVEVYEAMLCLGMLAAVLIDAGLQHLPYNWRWMVGAPVLPAILMSGVIARLMVCGCTELCFTALVAAAALVLLPESPRWLVVNGQLDAALAIIHRIYTKSDLPLGMVNNRSALRLQQTRPRQAGKGVIRPPGAQTSTAEVEQELMELWSSVEKDKAAARQRALDLRDRVAPCTAIVI